MRLFFQSFLAFLTTDCTDSADCHSPASKKDFKILDKFAGGSNPDDIAVAENLKAEGNAAKAIGGSQIGDVALDKYEEAWEKAVGSW